MLKFLAFIIAFYFIARYINRLFLGSGPGQGSFRPNDSGQQSRQGRNRSLDHIEDAEFEDLSDKN
ncbi:hypothetical protein AB2B38_006590 [Balneola sp. MJW-20]|uniref:hypothetical protein n=1 Tax=Gracilimonas aurantiaca TaxID=3234185 RepID=UPI003465C5BE